MLVSWVYGVYYPLGLGWSAHPLATWSGSTAAFPVKGFRASCASPLDGDPWPLCCEGCRGEGVVTAPKTLLLSLALRLFDLPAHLNPQPVSLLV
jgi:hypothetical protein